MSEAPTLGSLETRRAWSASTRITAAVVIAAFPLIFILDESQTGSSPVLPGLAILALILILLPLGLTEVAGRRVARGDARHTEIRLIRLESFAKVALVSASIWFLLWLALGA